MLSFSEFPKTHNIVLIIVANSYILFAMGLSLWGFLSDSDAQESPWKSSSIYPHHQSLPTLLLCALTYTSDFTGGCPPLPVSEKKKENLQLQLIKFLGVTVFQPTNSFGSPLACLNRFFRPHVIVQSLPTVRGMRCSKLSKYRFLWAVKRLIRNCIGEGFFTYWANVCC